MFGSSSTTRTRTASVTVFSPVVHGAFIAALVQSTRVGVGTMVTHNPLHRSGRAGFPHPALALGDDAKSPERVGMPDAGRGQPAVDEPPHPVPEDAAVLTPARQRTMPEPAHLEPKHVQRV